MQYFVIYLYQCKYDLPQCAITQRVFLSPKQELLPKPHYEFSPTPNNHNIDFSLISYRKCGFLANEPSY
jgi:hypothetical protein